MLLTEVRCASSTVADVVAIGADSRYAVIEPVRAALPQRTCVATSNQQQQQLQQGSGDSFYPLHVVKLHAKKYTMFHYDAVGIINRALFAF